MHLHKPLPKLGFNFRRIHFAGTQFVPKERFQVQRGPRLELQKKLQGKLQVAIVRVAVTAKKLHGSPATAMTR